ncbi:MAG TPA: protease pro-enzyme activation domain-containing protein, partial [Nitrososphaerales archaeon]|nr:protease pro-enzyme activation domain-containing protein [Nitrososphaerales archaeon]
MNLAERRLASITFIIPLLLIVLQTVPASVALTASQNSLPSRAFPGFRVTGFAPDSLPVTVSIAIPLRNLGLLSSLVKQVSDPASPMFRHFLTQQQLADDFYPTAKFDQLIQYLSTTGLQVQSTALDSAVVVHGTAAQVEKAFGTELKVYSNGTASYYMSTSQSFMGGYLLASNATSLVFRPAVHDLGTGGANVTFTEGAFSPKLLQRVYNASSLYSLGFNGSGKTIGILDFYGSPSIASDLKAFDKRFGFPDANFSIIPIGPYDPNLGAYTSWSTEISIDVEMSHAMAPGAAVDLYVGNGASTLSDAISKIVKDDKVNTLSQSFTDQDWVYNYYGPGFFDLNALMPDQYYMLGALKGITFTASTGDTGGTGDTSGIEGQLGYPSDSPFVTAVGGTQTYFAGSKFVQTGWSDLGFVPNGINYGGSTGGVSILEPKPWYQSAQSTPGSLPSGRMNPDLSLQSGVDPATEIVDSGQVIGEGGTSEASPLMAGLVALLDSSVNASVGLINPFLYSVGNNSTTYTEGYTPVTFGYTVPWVAAKGYNLVTGWGAPNIGEMSKLYQDAQSRPGLNVTVELYPGNYSSGLEYISGDLLRFNATIMDGSISVSSGSFAADLVTLTNVTQIPLRYDASGGVWTGSLRIQNQSGIAYVEVQGSSGGV